MTSRRKQIRPIKASCHSSDICLPKPECVSPNVEVDFSNVECFQFVQPLCSEIPIESVNNEVSCELTDKAIENVQINFMKNEETLEKMKLLNAMDDTLDEISKKMNKDEAKILPFQSSGGVDFFKCPLCEQSYICGRESLTIHLQEHQNKMKRDDGKHLCCLCSKELSSNSSLERHLLTHSNHRPFSCSMCDKKFTTNGNLSRHIKTSHTNNETVESGIDEVSKKHQTEADKTNQNDNKAIKYRKSSKMSRKEFGSINVGKSSVNVKDQNLIQPCLPTVDKYVPEPIFKTILPANMNFLSPFLSLNIGDFSLFPQNPPENLNFHQRNPITLVTEISEKSSPKTFNQLNKKNRLHHLKSLSINVFKKNKFYQRKRTFFINKTRKIKKRLQNFNIKCRKCGEIMLLFTKIIPHINKCYSQNSKELKYCLFTMCNLKFLSKKNLINHIKMSHMKNSRTCHQLSPISEPLNLSMKTCKLQNSPKESLHNVQKTISETDNFEINYVPQNVHHFVSDGILDFSVPNNPLRSLPKSIISQLALNNKSLNIFQSSNQFISSQPSFTASPMSLYNSHQSDWCNLNKMEFNDNNLYNSPKSDGHSHINNSSSKNGINITTSSMCCNGSESITTKSNSTEFSSNMLLAEDSKLKYNMGIKKKNSYKDAPKLITCPMEGCVQKFPWNSSLMRHILTHTAHKPFKCTRCTKCFSTKSNRERHMTRVHGVRINRSKFKSLQAAKASLEESSKMCEETADSENGNNLDETVFSNEKEMNITELSEEEWIIMDNNDKRAEDISNNLLKLAGQPLVEPNPVRLNNNNTSQILLLEKPISPKSDYSSKLSHSMSKDRLYLENSF